MSLTNLSERTIISVSRVAGGVKCETTLDAIVLEGDARLLRESGKPIERLL